MRAYRIGKVSRTLGLSIDTLRYYERIGLLPSVARSPSGVRAYDDQDISRLKFIKHAQLMNFTLAEIGALLELRENPGEAKADVRDLTQRKLDEINDRLESLQALRNELSLLVRRCNGSEERCPIISGIEAQDEDAAPFE